MHSYNVRFSVLALITQPELILKRSLLVILLPFRHLITIPILSQNIYIT